MLKKSFITLSTVAVVALSGTLVASPVAAQNLGEVKTERKEVQKKLSKAETEVAALIKEMNEINEEINRLQEALKENKKQVDKTTNQIDVLEDEVAELQEEIDVLQDKIEERNDILKNRIASYQENGGNIQYLEVFYGAKDFSEFISRISAVMTITQADTDLIEEQEKDKAVVEEKQSHVEGKLEEQENLLAELEEMQEVISLQEDKAEKEKKNLKSKESELNEKVSKLKMKDSDLAALQASLTAPIVQTTVTADNNGNSNNGNTTNNNSNNGNTTNNNSNGSNNSSKSPQAVPYTGGGGSAIAAGKQYIGRSTYSYGAQNPSSGLFDCSGFVQWAYKQEGVNLPRSASQMSRVGTSVSLSEAKPGDLVFFRGGGHVGIYLGGGKFLGSQSSTGVAVADMSSGYWKNNFDGIVKRVK